MDHCNNTIAVRRVNGGLLPKPGYLPRVACAVAIFAMWQLPAAAVPSGVGPIVDMFAQQALRDGAAVGVEVAVVIGTGKPAFFGYGASSTGNPAPPNENTVFHIASLTKLFTSNLLGQAVAAGSHQLSDTLGSFAPQLGALPVLTQQITLEQLADYTSGLPTVPPLCMAGQTPMLNGCLPGTVRPTVAQYNAGDFATFLRLYQIAGATPLPYRYSDIDLGLLGLLLAAPGSGKLENSALTHWKAAIATGISKPLGMHSTWLDVPASAVAREASGYTQAVAVANVANGGIAGLSLTNGGEFYTTPPAVTVRGGAGSGAQVDAQINQTTGAVSGFTIVAPGSGYVAPPSVVFGPGAPKSATGEAIISNGQIVGVNITVGGNYTAAPAVTFSGGRAGGADATATAFIDHGTVTYVQITQGGSGYVDPVSVNVAPGPASAPPLTIWAAAGGLKSSARDLATFSAAALGHTSIGTLAVPPAITAGFAIAETPYACTVGLPALDGCTAPEAGLAWNVVPGAPVAISKIGVLPGFSTYMVLLPAADTAVTLMVNSNVTDGIAPQLANNILYALWHEGVLGARR